MDSEEKRPFTPPPLPQQNRKAPETAEENREEAATEGKSRTRVAWIVIGVLVLAVVVALLIPKLAGSADLNKRPPKDTQYVQKNLPTVRYHSEPEETEPPATEPSEPEETQPPATEPEKTEPPATESEDPSQTFMVNQELLEVSGMTYGELRARYGELQIQDQAALEEDSGIWVGQTVVFPGAPGSGFYFDLYDIWFDCLDDQSENRGVFAPIGEIFPNYGDGYTLAELRELLPSARIMFTEVAGGDGDFRYYADRRPLAIGLDSYGVMITVGKDDDDSFFVGPETMAKLR